jgi:hypothetical protein
MPENVWDSRWLKCQAEGWEVMPNHTECSIAGNTKWLSHIRVLAWTFFRSFRPGADLQVGPPVRSSLDSDDAAHHYVLGLITYAGRNDVFAPGLGHTGDTDWCKRDGW